LFGIFPYTQEKVYVDYPFPQVPPPEFGPYDLYKAPNYLRPLTNTLPNFGLQALLGAGNDAKPRDG